MALTYRKTKSGEWAVFGPLSELKTGEVTVTKKDGTTKKEHVERVSKPFDVDGVPHAYGKVAPRQYGCSCEDSCCRPRCRCSYPCNCRGGYIYDC
jgi:hypothetical protein